MSERFCGCRVCLGVFVLVCVNAGIASRAVAGVAESASSASRLPERAGADQGGAVSTVIAAGQGKRRRSRRGN